tara:strand:- start:462 stop:659 length:198 start_codon:yes stop_codon:yes gene_type:complete
MGKLKSAMMDIGYKAMDIGIDDAASEFNMSEEDIKACVMFANSYSGRWEQFVSEGHWDDVGPIIH